MKYNRGKLHTYLGMTFYFTEIAKVGIIMYDYVERTIKAPMKIIRSDMVLTPSGNNLFEKDISKSMGKNKLKSFILH